MAPDDKNEWRREMIFEDPTPNGVINLRVLVPFINAFEYTDLTLFQREQFVFVMALMAKKLVAVWKHKEAYRELEDELITEARIGPPVDDLGHSQDLFLEFDEFLVQIKSALDVMVKVPVPILGRRIWSVKRFGDKGRDVLKAMDRCVPRRHAAAMRALRAMVFDRNKDWLEMTIDARDRINHFIDGGIPFQHFSVRRDETDNEKILVPMWSPEQTNRDAMGVIWIRCLAFVEAFVGFFFFLRLRPEWAYAYKHVPDEGIEPRWQIGRMGSFRPPAGGKAQLFPHEKEDPDGDHPLGEKRA